MNYNETYKADLYPRVWSNLNLYILIEFVPEAKIFSKSFLSNPFLILFILENLTIDDFDDQILESNDHILETIGEKLDEASGINKRERPVIPGRDGELIIKNSKSFRLVKF